ncbi:cobyrinic acid a,c-diamide synthase [Methanothermobacter thermautotrophicus]|jgi:cobyric acid synthase|uniref:Cobyrinic acid a,c-diamide synthase n=1 Tax=Methanothermobacter thermautotrophicus TaxID=145262 RepID=A0A842YKR6_METTF|nr:AAA family ATPase [Methanothermobacter thermautotrophicus]MBE2899936.1 cobyrinic acid a,c-diamide synthase [Methanothermobacter thermautotrophicus]MCQ8904098.1 AAA family ATPase [Methanothermobacter sp.]
MRIGLVCVRGSVPAFENFGFLPTDIVGANGLVKGSRAHRVLDGIIIPGGSIVESGSLSPELGSEIRRMAADGKFVLGICSGFQALAERTDIGRRSPCPVYREGLGLLNVTFHPMISNDRVEATITGESFLTSGMSGESITGFHCHTYGEIRGDAPEIMRSSIVRADYRERPGEIISGVCSDDGNVAGTMVHGCLDENPALVDNILEFLDADETSRERILEANRKLREALRSELGISTGIRVTDIGGVRGTPPAIMIASTGSDSGKTFILTGLAGALRRRGLRVGVIKVGPDVRDIVPALYLIKEPMEEHSSIRIGRLGWMELRDVLESVRGRYDIILIEGVMSILTGLLNDITPYSGAEIALAAGIPVIMVAGCSKGGIESAVVDLDAHIAVLEGLGVDVSCGILNRVYDMDIFERASGGRYLAIPRIEMSERGGTPEVEIKLEDFCLKAMETVEEHLDVDALIRLAKKPEFRGYMGPEEIRRVFRG